MPSHDELCDRIGDAYRDVPGEELAEVFNGISPDEVEYVGDGEYRWVVDTHAGEEEGTRQVEVGICWTGDGTWTTHYVEIPADTPDNRVEEVARAVVTSKRDWPAEIGGVFLYNDNP